MSIAKRIILAFLVPVAACMTGGCSLLAALASPRGNDVKIPAEVDLSARSERPMVIFVESARSVGLPALEGDLAAAIRAELIKKAPVQSKNLFVSGEASPARANSTIDFRLLSPSQIAKEQKAGTILYVRIEEFQLTKLHREGYYTGHMVAGAVVFDDIGNQLWPRDSGTHTVRVRDDLETKGSDTSRSNLIVAATHCICRYMYDCPRPDFNTKFEEVDYTQEKSWEE